MKIKSLKAIGKNQAFYRASSTKHRFKTKRSQPFLGNDRNQKEEAERDATSSLSQREREVAQLLAQGLLYKQIAERLGCSERTVKFHKARIAEKLGVKTPAEIALKLSSNAKQI